MDGKLKLIKLGIMIGILLMVVIIPTIQLPDEAEAATVLPIATIALDSPTQAADVSPGSLGTVEFSGTVTCELNSATSAIVSLSATDTWNSATVSPSALQFSSNDRGAKSFFVSVKAPLFTSRNQVGKVTVTGRVVMYPSTLVGTVQPREGVPGRIDIEPFYKFHISSPKKYQEVGPGQTLAFTLNIKNEGNSKDTFRITVENEDKLTDQGFIVQLSERQLDIEEQEEQKITIQVNTPIEWNLWKNKVTGIKVSVQSMLHMDEFGTPLLLDDTFKVRERGFSTPGFDPIFVILALAGLAVVIKTRANRNKRRMH